MSKHGSNSEHSRQMTFDPNYQTRMCEDTQMYHEREKWRIVNELDNLRKVIETDECCDVSTASEVISHAAKRIVFETNYISKLRKVLIDFVCWADGQDKYDEAIDKLMAMTQGILSQELVATETMYPEYAKLKKLVSFMLDQYRHCKSVELPIDKTVELLEEHFSHINEFVQIINYLENNHNYSVPESEKDSLHVNEPMPRSKEKLISDMMKLRQENAKLKDKLLHYETRYDVEKISQLEGLYTCSKNVVSSIKTNGANNEITIQLIQHLLGQTKQIAAYNRKKEEDKHNKAETNKNEE